MTAQGAIAVFVKTPGFSPLKTRLAAHLGKAHAETFHRLSTRCVVSVIKELMQQHSIQGYYAVAEEQAVKQRYWQDLPVLWQGTGNLGKKMATIYQTLLLQHSFVIVLGADIPQVSTDNVQAAITYLTQGKTFPFVLAPSDDGGFWLFGGSRTVPLSLWTDVCYSEENTRVQFINAIQSLGKVKILTCLCDVDHWEDLQLLAEQLIDSTDLSPEQQTLLTFIQALEYKT